MAEKGIPAVVTETKINGVIFIVESRFKKDGTETAEMKMKKVLQNELCGTRDC